MISLQRLLRIGHAYNRNAERGSIMIGLLVVGLSLTTIAVALLSFTSGTYSMAVRKTFAVNATQVAEAGIETSLNQLNQNGSFSGYATEQVFFDNATQGRGVYTTVVANGATGDAKTITSTGKVYRYGTTTNPVQTRKVRVVVVGTASPGYSVHTGPGGLLLSGSANITNSDVYVNGYITMSGASKIGTTSKPSNVYVANYRCPTGSNPGATFPELCTGSNGQNPITLAYSTYIYGTVCATGQTSTGPNPSGNIQTGNGGAGLQIGCVAPQVAPPTYDRAAHVAGVTTTAASNNSTYTCTGNQTKTWPANLRLNGSISIANSCKLTITGNVFITGDLTIGGAAQITIADSVGATRPVIMVDGKIDMGGSARILSNSAGTGAQFISYKSTAACNPGCTAVTGNDLYNSMQQETVKISGAVNLPGMIFQAYWGKITLSGSGNLGSAIGQTVDLSGAGTVLFGTTLASGTSTWSITGYQRLYD